MGDEQHAQLIAADLEPSGEFTAAQVLRKLESLGLVEPSRKQSRRKGRSGRDDFQKGQNSPARKANRRISSDGSRRSSLFTEAQDQALKELFERLVLPFHQMVLFARYLYSDKDYAKLKE
jgi:hypothetical protein